MVGLEFRNDSNQTSCSRYFHVLKKCYFLCKIIFSAYTASIKLSNLINNDSETEILDMALTKKDIAGRIAEETDLPYNHSSEIVESILEIIKSALESGEDLLVSGFGKFCVVEKRARKGRNPATGDDMILQARKIVKFSSSDKLKDSINNKDR